jgi:hypothetical protein
MENSHELSFNMQAPYLNDPESYGLIRSDDSEFRLYGMKKTAV